MITLKKVVVFFGCGGWSLMISFRFFLTRGVKGWFEL